MGPRALRNYRESRTGEFWQRGRKVSFILSGAWCPPPGFPGLALLPGRGRCSGGLLLCEVDTRTSRAGSSLFLPWSPSSWGRHPVCEPCPPEAQSPVQSLLILLNEKGSRCAVTLQPHWARDGLLGEKRGPVTSVGPLAPGTSGPSGPPLKSVVGRRL